jgi:hypothetical protein
LEDCHGDEAQRSFSSCGRRDRIAEHYAGSRAAEISGSEVLGLDTEKLHRLRVAGVIK